MVEGGGGGEVGWVKEGKTTVELRVRELGERNWEARERDEAQRGNFRRVKKSKIPKR